MMQQIAVFSKRHLATRNNKVKAVCRFISDETHAHHHAWLYFSESEMASFVGLQVDEGGSKRFFQNVWTSFLKARLVCGFPEESLYFNRLQDIYTLQAEDWRDTKFYALFTSSWLDTFSSFFLFATEAS